MADYLVHKVTALPSNLQPHSIYLVAPTAGPADYLEIYVTDAAGTATRKTLTRPQIQAMIDAAVASASGGGTVFVDDIAGRDALTPDNAQRVYVVNATGDGTVATGGAEYIWRASPGLWIKLSEAESQDLVQAWANIIGKPDSSPAAIDDAVTKRHSHANATQLANIGEDQEQNLTYRGARPRIAWDTANW